MSEQIRTRLNGQDRTFEASIESSALELLREQAGLTGAKLVCGSGACGACTILVDGEAKCACLLPATHLHRRSVETVEAHGPGQLHPVQRAFLAHDGLQCGYCTPGFINEGIAFYNEWRAKEGQKRPGREQIAEAMAGHLCRCAAYVGIYEAIATACAGDFDGPEMPDYQRVDGPAKVTGAAKYTTDIQLPGQLVGAIYRSPHPRARLLGIDSSKAAAMPGVKALVSLHEGESIHYEGQPLLALAAETEAQAHAALQAIDARYDVLPFLTDPVAARQPGAPVIVPEDRKAITAASEGPPLPGKWEGNVRSSSLSLSSSNKGQVIRSLQENAGTKRYQATFHTPTQFHTTLEPHCAVADWRADGSLTVYASTQAVYYLARDIAKHYKLPEDKVTVLADYVGGGFGSKLTFRTEHRAAIELSQAAGAPVALIYSRAEEFSETGFRPPGQIELAIAAQPDGSGAGFEMKSYGSSGFALGSNISDIAGLNYTGLAKKLEDFDVLTNFAPGCAFRGPSGPAAIFALEQGIDQLAEELAMDPIAFRRKWEEHEGYVTLFDWVEAQPLWQRRKAAASQTGRFRKGIGLAFGAWFHFYMPTATVEVASGPEGIAVRNAVQDMGQGSKSVLAQAVAEVFQLPPSQIRVEAGDSRLSIGPTSGGSRTATSIYPAAKEAAIGLRELLIQENGIQDAEFVNGGVQHSGGFSTWQALAAQAAPQRVRAERGRNKGFNPMGLLPLPQGLSFGKDRGYGVYIAEVEVDTLLGKTRVLEVQGAMRVGKIHVRAHAESQCYGGVIQGIGHALYEERSLCPTTGRLLGRGLEDYRIPGMGDVPLIKVDFIEEGFELVKEKGIGIAELCTVPVAGCIANAVYNATGWRPLQAPLTPQRVLAGLGSV